MKPPARVRQRVLLGNSEHQSDMASKGAASGSQAGSSGPLESFNYLSSCGPNIEERERDLFEFTTDEGDADLSLAFVNVRDRVADETLTVEDAEEVRGRYRKLHSLVLTAHKEEREIILSLKSLHNECMGEKIRLEEARSTHEASLDEVRKLEERRDAETAALHEAETRETELRYELNKLGVSMDDTNFQLEELLRENSHTVNPELERLQGLTEGMQAELERLETEIAKDQSIKDNMLKKVDALDDERIDLGKQQERLKTLVVKIESEPDRIQKQAESVQRAATSLQAEVGRLKAKIAEAEQETEVIRKKREEAMELKKNLGQKLEMQRGTLQHRQKDVEVVKKNFELERARNHHLLTERVELVLAEKGGNEKLRIERDRSSMERKFLEILKRKLRKKRAIVEAARQVIPLLEQQLKGAQEDLKEQKKDAKDLTDQAEILRQDVDIGLAKFLSQEMAEEAKRSELSALMEQVDVLEVEILQWIEEEKRQHKLVSLLKRQRDVKMAEAMRAKQEAKDTVEQMKMNELVVADLSKQCNDANNRLKEFSALYDVVKNERNKYVHLIQSSHQALAEMKENIKILQNEVDILQNESFAKEKALRKEQVAHRASQAQRDGLRSEMNSTSLQYRGKQQVVEQQIVEIEKQNFTINGLEKEMLRLKAMYETALEQRNLTGVQLIDRNDELCVLYEKSNIQETILTEGTLAIQKREEDIKMLRLQVAELARRLEAESRRPTKAPDGAQKLVAMHDELQQKRAVTEKLSQELEDPGNLVRWRALGGEDPSTKQLECTILVLEDRLSAKKETLLEKELVLEEVVCLTRKLRKQANDNRTETLLLSKKVAAFQGKIQDATRQMMATVSELAMYQAIALKLQQEQTTRERKLKEARNRAENGEPPTEDAVWDLHRLEQKIVKAETARLERAEAEAAGEAPMPPSMIRTTAEPRPNAYIPDELGIPKPYGGMGPFKPTEGGTTMRHIRTPRPRQIEI